MESYGGIILAAGSSRRFGEDKRNLQLSSGHTMLEETIQTASACLENLLVVLRYGDRAYATQLEGNVANPSVRYYLAPDSALGMAHSLANAIREVEDWQAALIILGDLPFIQQSTYQAIVAQYLQSAADQPILIPRFEGKAGHPVLFDHVYFAEISELQGDVGARSVVDAHRDRVIEIDVEDAGILQDIDLPEDLKT
ncbi:MAG: nucleotidyltransferase family protein [Pseudomonadales bacterium]|jgi:molybdenum cofactor cytidylyltransferase|nr:nucleotidyltransferase family protein [Pseudomonadales bacterium]MDP7358057.1 nucleotidyltransferase family protein [Pseudomonadales bacterium]HJN51444.1 nucleotidyltransferase family protein [Pseudomonadales bacterium]|tara:strand:- start:5361 stop:5951 length:591 start_codon:yes stop_codon:yes gene_type:complete